MNNPETKTYVKTGRPEFDNLFPMVQAFLQKNILDVVVDGKKIRGYRSPDAKSIWIRDYSDMIRGFKYFEQDLKSTVEHFAETQSSSGRIFDYFTTFPEKLPCERENWSKYVRVPVEADVEYRFVKAAFLVWQATGEDIWLQKLLPHMKKALLYVLNHAWRWDSRYHLVKRAYTIDTWDFAYTAGTHEWLQFQITDDTYWGIMHCDNSGYYEAFSIMTLLYNTFHDQKKARYWQKMANAIKTEMNRVCWNGNFYTHFVKLCPVEIPGVEETAQLSLSNPMAINRKAASHEMAVSIISEYLRRKDKTAAFAEWFSMDPPFPDGIFGDEKLRRGRYVNGGIMPLVGGELAKAAFDHGFETYGVDILKRYYGMISKSGESFLWYFPDGTAPTMETSTSPEASPADGWGSSAMLYALLEGLAGIEDRGKGFDTVRISPRWLSANVHEAEVQVEYRASGAHIGYKFSLEPDILVMDVQTPSSVVQFHILLSKNTCVDRVLVNKKELNFTHSQIEQSRYVDFETKIHTSAEIQIKLNQKEQP